jgi:hypothetical protein
MTGQTTAEGSGGLAGWGWFSRGKGLALSSAIHDRNKG